MPRKTLRTMTTGPVLGVLAAAALTIQVGTSPAAAQDAVPAQAAASAAECSVDGKGAMGDQDEAFTMTRRDGAEADQAVAAVNASIAGGDVAVQASPGLLVRDDARAYLVDTGPEAFTSVTIPVGGRWSEPLSNLTVLVDADGDVVQHSETLVGRGPSGTFTVTSYVDGVLTGTQDTGFRHVSDDQLRDGLTPAAGTTADPTVPLQDKGELSQGQSAAASAGAQNTAACLASVLGISGVAAGVLAVMCSGSCAVPITPVTAPVCAACIGGAAVIGGASIAAVASCW